MTGYPRTKRMHGARKIVRTRQGVRFTLEFDWDRRLADIWIEGVPGYPVDCLQVHEYDFATGTLTVSTRPEIVQRFEEWLGDNESTFIAERPYL